MLESDDVHRSTLLPDEEHTVDALTKRLLALLVLCMVTAVVAQPIARAQDTRDPNDPQESINFMDVGLDKILEWVAKKSNKRFLFDRNKLSGKKVTLLAHETIPAEALFSVFETIMMDNGFALVPHGKNDPSDRETAEVILVVDARQVKSAVKTYQPDDKIPERDHLVTVVYPLKYASAVDASRTVQAFASPTGTQTPINNTNVLVVTDYASNMTKIQDVVAQLDVEGPKLQQKVVTLQFADAEYMRTMIQAFFQASRQAAGQRNQPGVTNLSSQAEVMADRRTNSLILFATENQIVDAEQLIARLDVDTTISSGGLYVVKLKHTDAEEIANTLKEIYGLIDTRNRQAGAAQPANVSTAAGDQPPGIVADKQNNSLLIAATRSQFEELKFVLDQLDVYRPQVLIEAAIVEVATDDFEKIGLELATADQPKEGSVRFFGASSFGLSQIGIDTAENLITRTPVPSQGLIAGITKNSITNIPVLLNALQTSTEIRVLDRPSLLCVENEEGYIKVSDDVPVSQLNNATSVGQVATQTFSDYVSAEVSMKFKPHIVRGRYVRLEIQPLIIQSFGSATPGSNLPPPRRNREASAVVTIPNKHTLIMGGYVGDLESNDETKVPFLADLPVVGRAFKTPAERRLKKAIFIFITPHILDDVNFNKAKDVTAVDMQRLRDMGMDKQLEVVENYYGQQRLLRFRPRSLELIDYKSPSESLLQDK